MEMKQTNFLRIIFCIVIISSIVFVSSCEEQNSEVEIGEDATENQENANSGNVEDVVNANNQLAFDLYFQFKEENKDKNIFFSPYSINVALTVAYEGANGQTKNEMASVLHVSDNLENQRAAFVNISNEINKDNKTYELSTANALWAENEFTFLKAYFDIVEMYYGAKVENLNFKGDAEGSRIIINDWVAEQTYDKIEDLIPSGAIDQDTRLVITNAIYFKGDWVKQFDKNETKEADFRVTSDKTVKISMMQRTDKESIFGYAETDDLQILELPYSGEELSILIVLPKEDDLESLEESLTLEEFSKWRESLQEQRVNIYLPKFTFETKYFMSDSLSAMGMPTAFSEYYADFSGMTGKKNLVIFEVIHQAFVDVNEEGTEAAAATAVIISEIVSVKPPVPEFRADHPFIFIIQQKETGNILFMGRVNEPVYYKQE